MRGLLRFARNDGLLRILVLAEVMLKLLPAHGALAAFHPAGRFGEGILHTYPGPLNLRVSILFIINFVLTIVAVVALGLVVYGGFRYMSARGNEQELEAAKQTITQAVIAVVIIGLATAILNFVIGSVLYIPR